MLTITTPGGQPLAHIHTKTMKTPDEEVIDAFLKAKIKVLKLKAPGYICLTLEVRHHKSSVDSEVTYRAYCEHIGHSDYADSADAAIAQIASRVSGKTEAQMLREKANALLQQAQGLEEAAVDA